LKTVLDALNKQNQSALEALPILPESKILVQFDGLCVLCSRTVKFILKADKKKKFTFQALANFPEIDSPETVIVTDRYGKYYSHFDAVLKIGYELGGIFRIVAIFKILPRSWRNSIYKWVARNRFRWFGIRNTCYIPSSEEKSRFI
jgi:predicted DCC family thiol-disulfide oxidoreductase YuxK